MPLSITCCEKSLYVNNKIQISFDQNPLLPGSQLLLSGSDKQHCLFICSSIERSECHSYRKTSRCSRTLR